MGRHFGWKPTTGAYPPEAQVIRILCNRQPRETCREAFQELKILTVDYLYILEAIINVSLICNGS